MTSSAAPTTIEMLMPDISPPKHEVAAYVLALMMGVTAGVLEVKVSDLMLTAIAVMIFTMFLGAVWPRQPWRWLLLVATCVPILRLIAYLALSEHATRAAVLESFLGFLTGLVGVYGGALLNQAWQSLKKTTDPDKGIG